MANKEISIICKNIFKNTNENARRNEYLQKWAELISMWEKYRESEKVR